ncbi:hypothetical protein HUW51_17080 [Adhaeribacter swui]|uniref:Phage major capsid protein n=1 Tax=Adhaeribacter swui TaxID=2086471 RepID=A0A7G7GB18_9BACT|nr:hypothetical protein [Adhaeribacter swui]QNF34352.1 hypothetical protein HUW51_17080 [Adhaeribacter swui]
MNIADIKAEFGAYYLNNGQNLARLFKLLNITSVTDSVLTPIKTDETVWQASKASIGRVLQPFQKAWTPIGQAEFKPLSIQQFKMKIDSQEYPDDLEASWLGFLAGEGIDRKSWPFVRWFVETLLIPQAAEDYELNEVFKGVRVEPTAGTAGAAGTSMNGLRKAINDNITAGRITPIVTGALSSDNKTLVEQFETFVDAINLRYQHIPMQLCVQPSVERRFHRGYRALYGKDTDYKGSNGSVDFSNITIIGLPSMIGSNKIWCTPKGNAIHMGKRTQNKNSVQIENVDRLIKMYSDWSSGVGFILPEVVFTNDQDLT